MKKRLVEDVNKLYAELKAKGIAFLGEPADHDWRARLVGRKNPDGNNLYLLQYLSIGAFSQQGMSAGKGRGR